MINLPYGSSVFRSLKCAVETCRLSENVLDLPRADAVIFHGSNLTLNFPLPEKSSSQKWIFFTTQPPQKTLPIGNRDILQKIDWTSTYSSESDIRIPYGKFIWGTTDGNSSPPLTRKSRLATHFSNQCSTPNFRSLYVDSLVSHLGADDVAIYGKCGKPCSAGENCLKSSAGYKFYLAFEESSCKEYISDEFWNKALANNLVPVVMGASRADYERYAPPGSFIHVEDFASAKELADFLRKTGADSEAYEQYFDWRAVGKVEVYVKKFDISHSQYWCDLCEALHNPKKIHVGVSYRPIWEWWNKERQCNTKFLWKEIETKSKDMDI